MTAEPSKLRQSLLNGSVWTIFGFGAGQVLRFGKSLILTRLLFPDAYGVMSVVWSVLYALGMLSDAGLSAAAIRHPKGDTPDFLNTLWTAKVIRGTLIFITTCCISHPISLYCKMPDLVWLIPLAGSTMLIAGFNSTNVYSLQRKMEYRHTTILDFSNEVLISTITIAWAYLSPSMSSLIGGTIIGAIYYMVCTHTILPGIKNRFRWDMPAIHDIFHFGKWVFASSVIFLISVQGDKFILARYLDATMLGIYSIAIMLSEVVSGVISKLNANVFYTALSQVINTDRTQLKNKFYKLRLGIDFALIMPIAILLVVSEDVIRLLYDPRYHAAGWMLQILCVRLLMIAQLSSSESCLFSLGKPQYAVVLNICRASWIIIGVPIAWHAYGMEGVVWTVATTEVLVCLVLWRGMAREKLLSIIYEFRSAVVTLAGLILGYFIKKLIF
jgi:O-antigen/teichoic acid export membrane protein